jgi:hypothetical protein
LLELFELHADGRLRSSELHGRPRETAQVYSGHYRTQGIDIKSRIHFTIPEARL